MDKWCVIARYFSLAGSLLNWLRTACPMTLIKKRHRKVPIERSSHTVLFLVLDRGGGQNQDWHCTPFQTSAEDVSTGISIFKQNSVSKKFFRNLYVKKGQRRSHLVELGLTNTLKIKHFSCLVESSKPTKVVMRVYVKSVAQNHADFLYEK